MPEMRIGQPPTPWESFLSLAGAWIATMSAGGIILGIATGNIGFFIAAVAIPVLGSIGFFGQLATMKRDERRKRRALAATAPPGALFVASATPVDITGAFPRKWIRAQQRSPGVLTVTADAVTYMPTRGGDVGLYGFRWDDVTRIELAPVNPIAGTLTVTSSEGRSIRWRVMSLPDLIEALESLRDLPESPQQG